LKKKGKKEKKSNPLPLKTTKHHPLMPPKKNYLESSPLHKRNNPFRKNGKRGKSFMWGRYEV
jgi:hypothetical protein